MNVLIVASSIYLFFGTSLFCFHPAIQLVYTKYTSCTRKAQLCKHRDTSASRSTARWSTDAQHQEHKVKICAFAIGLKIVVSDGIHLIMSRITLFLSLLFTLQLQGQHCLPDYLTLSRQGQIDSFSILYPGCTDIENELTLNSSNIKNLQGLRPPGSLLFFFATYFFQIIN